MIQIMVKDGEISTREVTHVPEVDEETLRRSLGALKVPHFDPARRARYIANLVDQEERKKEANHGCNQHGRMVNRLCSIWHDPRNGTFMSIKEKNRCRVGSSASANV